MRRTSRRKEMGEEAWAEYQRERIIKKEQIGKRIRSEAVVNWRRRTKIRLILYKGGKCEKCGYDNLDAPSVFHFHHPDPTQKDFSISGKSAKFETLRNEVDKCCLYCSNCHGEIHDTINNEIRSKTIERYQTELDEIKKIGYDEFRRLQKEKAIKISTCPQCGKQFRPLNNDQKYCCHGCWALVYRRVLIRPTKEELEKMLDTMYYTEIGRLYKVSDNTIRKWAKGYGIIQ
jgi:tRNA A37 N6-isopentenylltransferase MiaA